MFVVARYAVNHAALPALLPIVIGDGLDFGLDLVAIEALPLGSARRGAAKAMMVLSAVVSAAIMWHVFRTEMRRGRIDVAQFRDLSALMALMGIVSLTNVNSIALLPWVGETPYANFPTHHIMKLSLATVFLENIPQLTIQLVNVAVYGVELNPVIACSVVTSAVCVVLELGRKGAVLGLGRRRSTLLGGRLGGRAGGGGRGGARELREVRALFCAARVAGQGDAVPQSAVRGILAEAGFDPGEVATLWADGHLDAARDSVGAVGWTAFENLYLLLKDRTLESTIARLQAELAASRRTAASVNGGGGGGDGGGDGGGAHETRAAAPPAPADTSGSRGGGRIDSGGGEHAIRGRVSSVQFATAEIRRQSSRVARLVAGAATRWRRRVAAARRDPARVRGEMDAASEALARQPVLTFFATSSFMSIGESYSRSLVIASYLCVRLARQRDEQRRKLEQRLARRRKTSLRKSSLTLGGVNSSGGGGGSGIVRHLSQAVSEAVSGMFGRRRSSLQAVVPTPPPPPEEDINADATVAAPVATKADGGETDARRRSDGTRTTTVTTTRKTETVTTTETTTTTTAAPPPSSAAQMLEDGAAVLARAKARAAEAGGGGAAAGAAEPASWFGAALSAATARTDLAQAAAAEQAGQASGQPAGRSTSAVMRDTAALLAALDARDQQNSQMQLT